MSARPTFVEDLADGDPATQELSVSGDTKHIERLTEFKKLKTLIAWGIGTKPFEWICKLDWISTLVVLGLRVPDLGPAIGLTGLRTLMLLDNTKAESLAPLNELHELRALVLEHWPQVRSLEPLNSLTKLEGLSIQGGNSEVMEVESLRPLASLTELRELLLPKLKALDKNLSPLSALRKLEYLQVPNFYPVEEFARLAAALPTTEGNCLKPYWKTSLTCPQFLCFRKLVLPLGDTDTHVCPWHGRKRIEEHVALFEAEKKRAGIDAGREAHP